MTTQRFVPRARAFVTTQRFVPRAPLLEARRRSWTAEKKWRRVQHVVAIVHCGDRWAADASTPLRCPNRRMHHAAPTPIRRVPGCPCARPCGSCMDDRQGVHWGAHLVLRRLHVRRQQVDYLLHALLARNPLQPRHAACAVAAEALVEASLYSTGSASAAHQPPASFVSGGVRRIGETYDGRCT